MKVRLCWCHRPATHVTAGALPDYLCYAHAMELAATVKVERFFQDCDDVHALLPEIVLRAMRIA